MLREHGLLRTTVGRQEYCFRPSFERICALGHPHEIVELFGALHGPRAEVEARYILASLCDQDEAFPVVGWRDASGDHAGAMPAAEQVILARHLMQHGMIGRARPDRKGDGQFVAEFHATEYIAAARVHLGLSSTDAAALSMTEFQDLMEMKFPPKGGRVRDMPTAEEYDASMKAFEESRRG